MILVFPKQELERESKWFCGVKFFRSDFKVELESGVWTQICFLAGGFLDLLITWGILTLRFTAFLIFLALVFFPNGLPNPIIVLSRPFLKLINENSLNWMSGLVLLCFFRRDFRCDHFCSFVRAIATAFCAWRYFLLVVERVFNSRPQPLNGYYLGALLYFNLLYLLITFFVLHESEFSRLRSDLLHSLFQLHGFQFLSRIQLRNVVNTVKINRSKSKETG